MFENALKHIFKIPWDILTIIFSLISILLFAVLKIVSFSSPQLPLIIATFIGGIPLIVGIIYKMTQGDLGADLLAAIAIITAIFLNQYLAAVIIVLMLASGQALEDYAMRKASSVISSLVERMPQIAHCKKPTGIVDVPLLDIQIGDEVVVYPHEVCPVDGLVIEGRGSMDESYLTGEPYKISKAPGTSVISGAINGETVLILRAQKLPSDSRYAAIVKVLQQAEQQRPRIRRLGDQIGAIFAPFSLLIALAAWYYSGETSRFLAVLVIATPCPLLIGIPITLISAISMAAKQAIILKDPTVLEQLPKCRTAIFDKTGTLTYGKPVLTEMKIAGEMGENSVLQYAASLERYSKHPLANGILSVAEEHGLPLLDVSTVQEKPGEGLSGVIGEDHILITNRNGLSQYDPETAERMVSVASGLECFVLFNHKYVASLHFRDIPRVDSRSFIGHLKPSHQFSKIVLLSGDRWAEVEYLASELALTEVHAEQSPEEKLALVRSETKVAPTLFMGDGINDAPALTAATVGVAFGQYNNVTAEAAGAVIMESSLAKADELIHLSIATRRIALQSAIGGMALSLIGMGFAAGGYISPVYGALLQELIDIIAILNSLQLIWGKKIKTDFIDEG